MKKNVFNPKEYLEQKITESNCDHLVVSKSGFDDGLYGNYYDCLICGKHLSFSYNQGLDDELHYIITTYGCLTPNIIEIYINYIKKICLEYKADKGINIVTLLKGYKPKIDKAIEKTEKKKRKIDFEKEHLLIDLHTHTNFSDGELSPNELLRLAINKGIGTISITDHDTLLGNQNIVFDTYEGEMLNIISGIELSAKIDRGRMHILGYGIDINDSSLNKKMKEIKNNSIYSILILINQLKKDYGIIISTEDIQMLINAKHNLGRPDLTKILVKYGLATDSQNAFDRYLIDAHNKTRLDVKGLSYEECIDLITKSGGIPILAHPKTLELTEEELLILIKKMISVGLKGIEVYHSSHLDSEIEIYQNVVDNLNLLYSGGSDFHGSFIKPNVEIGTGINNNLKIKKLSLLDHIKR